jgi:tetratricopeptide (TPR) repeat protein
MFGIVAKTSRDSRMAKVKRLALPAALLLAAGFLRGQAPGTKARDPKAPVLKVSSPEELALQGKVRQAVNLARKSPTGASDTLKSLMEKADGHITALQVAEAEATLDVAEKFLNEYTRVEKRKPVPSEGLKGRQLRLQAILLSNQKQFDKSEPLLKEALALSKQAGDVSLEAGIHNNLGYLFLSTGKGEESVKEFTTAREMVESLKDDQRASSYNFNLGLAQYQQKKFEPALEAFRRSAQQSNAISQPSLEARAVFWQGRALSAINVVSPESIKLFSNAQKMFQSLGDHRNEGRSFMAMADHTAYTMDFNRAASFAEQAVQVYRKAGDNDGLRESYGFLVEIYGRSGKKNKAEEYRKKLQELTPAKN